MKKNLHPPIGRFLSLFLASFFLLVFITILVIIKNKNTSQLTLIANENKFNLNFDITNNEQSEFAKALEKLSLPQSVAKGVEFELDATSSTKLTFATPIGADLKILPGKITFMGKVNTSFLQDQETKSIKIPISANMAVFSDNLLAFIKSRLIISQEFSNWLSRNLASDNGQYLVVFGPNSDFALIFNNPNIDLEDLKNIKDSQSDESLYKEELKDNTKLYLFKLPQALNGEDLTCVFFQEGDLTYFTSSYEAAQELINVLKSQTPSLDFPQKDISKASLIILFRNNDQNSAGDEFTNFILPGSNNYSRSINQVRELDFILRSNEFSGLINLK